MAIQINPLTGPRDIIIWTARLFTNLPPRARLPEKNRCFCQRCCLERCPGLQRTSFFCVSINFLFEPSGSITQWHPRSRVRQSASRIEPQYRKRWGLKLQNSSQMVCCTLPWKTVSQTVRVEPQKL